MAIDDMTQIEVALINKRKVDLDAEIRPLLQQVAQAIPDFTDKNTYVQRISDIIFSEMWNDPQFNAAILDQQTTALFEAICMDLTPAHRAELGLENLCL